MLIGTGVQAVWGSSIGQLSGWYHAQVCGLPGGIDYLNSFLVEIGVMDKATRLAWALQINSYLRAPLLCSSAYVG